MLYENILFDLDGTIIDSKPGIVNCIKYALDQLGISEPNEAVFNNFIGPPLYYSFRKQYGFDDETAKFAVEKYRERYSAVGVTECSLYDDVKDALEFIYGKADIRLATLKPTHYAERILSDLGVRRYFGEVIGSTPEHSQPDKSEIIAAALRNAAHPASAVMIGDRKYDIDGAAAVGIDSIGVLYGYGTKEELSSATYILNDISELKLLLSQK